MPGALNVTKPTHLLAKLDYELQVLAGDHFNSYAAINALRDAYHLREWIWHGRLERDPALQVIVIGVSGDEGSWRAWVNEQFPDFPIIRDLCNGSKHFEDDPRTNVQATSRAGYGSPLFAYGSGLGYGIGGFFVHVGAGRFISVANLIERILGFWAELFQRFPQLG
jgi:hypothetical protein